MHCLSCDRLLSDLKTVTKNLEGQYEDLCSNCIEESRREPLEGDMSWEGEIEFSPHPDTLFKPLTEETDDGN